MADAFPILMEHASVISALFPPNPGDKELVDFLTSRGEATGVKVTALELGDPEALVLTETKVGKSDLLKDLDKAVVNEVSVISFQMTIRGDFKSLLNFLNTLKASGRFIRVERVNGPTGQEKGVYAPGLQEWQLSGSMYFTSEKLQIKAKFQELAANISRLTGIRLPEQTENPVAPQGGDNLISEGESLPDKNSSKGATSPESSAVTKSTSEEEGSKQ